MRKYIKKIALRLIEDLRSTNSWIATFEFDSMNQQTEQEILEVLTVEQETAIKLGEEIENSEGEGTVGVKFLEDYCELLWKISQKNEKEQHKLLLEQLENVLENIKEEIYNLPEQYEIVFLPYKASMWDCMESVWTAAKADTDCIVKVIPIPYFDRDKDGKVSEMHYEANLMPDYVEITHYNNYNFEEKHPEIVYIHNPYDGGNKVTCVHPKFFSSELKENTDMLVYIPYFMGGFGPYDEMHWNLPAYRYIDKIIVQDESKLEGLSQFVPLEKIVVAGSPKADRVYKLEAEKQWIIDMQIPQYWYEKIQGKKVFLYNISISGILRNSATAMEKIKHVLRLFATREDVILLWRPHPLIESTLKALRPELYQEYIKIKEEFIEQNKGIYDETADAGISVAISDAYIGEDSSSLVHYFGMTGKNVFYTDWKVREHKLEERKVLQMPDCFLEDNKIYFTPIANGLEHWLYKLNLKTGELDLDVVMPGIAYGLKEYYKYCAIASIHSKVVLAGHNLNEIYIYDRRYHKAVKLILSETRKLQAFCASILYKENLILIPQNYPAIVNVDVHNYELIEYKECMTSFVSEDNNEPAFGWAYAVRKNLLYMATAKESKMLIFNMDTGEYKIKEIAKYEYGYEHMMYDGRYFWLSVRGKTSIVRWDEESNEAWEVPYMLGEDSKVTTDIAVPIDCGDWVYVVHTMDDLMHKINKRTMTVEVYNPFGQNHQAEGKEEELMEGYFFVRMLDEQNMVALRRADYNLVIWNVVSGEYGIYPIRMNYEQMIVAEREKINAIKLYNAVPVAVTEHMVGIEAFVDYVAHLHQVKDIKLQNAYQNCMVNMKQNAGIKIHQVIKKSYE